MTIEMILTTKKYRVEGAFTISRGSRTHAEVLICTLSDGVYSGNGECTPYSRYNENINSVMKQLLSTKHLLNTDLTHEKIQTLLPAGAARNALDCAFWDYEAKKTGVSVAKCIYGSTKLQPLETAITISLDTPEKMAEKAETLSKTHSLLKVKVGTPNDIERFNAVARAAPECRIILDANEGWTNENLHKNIKAAAQSNVVLIEQPLPANDDEILRTIKTPISICADESVHTRESLYELVGKYDAVNIKLDKTGGLSEALLIKEKAIELGFDIMVGCMLGSSLAMAAAFHLAQGANFVDLDGPLLLAQDHKPQIIYNAAQMSLPNANLWG